MSNKKQIQILDFNLFVDVIKAATKIVESAKLTINENGIEIYGCRGKMNRCELTSNSISCDESVDIYIEKLATFYKVLMSIKEIHNDDYSDFKFFVDLPKICFESKKFKTKFQTQSGELEVITKWVSKKVETVLKPEFEFTTTSDLIKRINSHSFIFEKIDDVRVYLDVDQSMEKNSVFATIGNKNSDLNNEMTLKFGIVTFGKLANDRKLILDLEHLNLFNAIQSSEIKIFLPEKYNMLISKIKVLGKNDSYFNMNIYNGILKN